MIFFNLSSIRKNFALIVFLAVLPAVAILFYSGMEHRRNTIEHTKKDVLLLTHSMAQVQKDIALSAREILSTLALMTEIHVLDIQAINAIFKNLLKINSNYTNIVLVDLHGNVLASGIPSKGVNLADRKQFRDVLKTKDFATGEYILTRIGNAAPAFPFSYPVIDATGTLKAVLAVAVDLTLFAELYHDASLPKNSFVAITDYQGIRLVYYPPKKSTNPIGKPIKNSNWEIAQKAQESGIMTAVGSDSTNRILAFEPIRLKANADPYMYVWAGVPESFILAPANIILKRNLFLILLTTMGALFISWGLGRKTLIEPIHNLIDMTEEFTKGNFKKRIKKTERIDEFEKLTESFYSMAESLSKNQEKLQNSEDRFKNLSGVTFEGIVIHNKGIVEDVNDSLTELFGYKSEEIIGSNAIELFFPNDSRSLIYENISKHIATPYEVMGRKKNGTLFPVEIESRDIIKGDEHFRVSALRDITERKRAEELLRESEDMFHLMANSAPVLIWISCQDKFCYWFNKVWLDYTGRTIEQEIGNGWLEGVHPEDLAHCLEIYTGHFDRRQPFTMDYRLRRHDGAFRWMADSGIPRYDTTGTFVGYIGSCIDITERKRAEEDRERLKHAIEQSGETIVITDPQGVIQYVNPTFTQVTGYSSQEAIAQKTSILKSGKHDDTFYRGLWDTISNGNTWKGRMTNKKKDGSHYTEEATISPVVGPDGEVVNYIAVKLDISEKIRAEQERLQLEKQFIQAQKMDLVGQLAGGVAHDFNNMLSVILGYTDLAMDQLGDPTQPLFAEMQAIRKAAERSADLTKQLLAFARKQTIDPKILDMNEVVAGTLNMLNRLIGENITLIWLPGKKLWPVKIDPTQVDQILANLCVNGRDAINGTGKISIETGHAVLDEAYCATKPEFVPGEYVSLVVSDDGCGMDQETLNKLFEPFFTTKEIGKGTGLGLATIYGIVKQNNGFINVDSQLGHGSIFSIYFAPHKDKALHVQKVDLAEPAKRGHETILLVEDESSIMEMIEIMLGRLGYNVLAASCPKEALGLAAKHAGTIDLLLTDVVMPEMNGRDLAENLLSLFPKLKHLFMSGYTADIIGRQGVLDEGVQFIQKPFNMKDLATKIRGVLGEDPDE